MKRLSAPLIAVAILLLPSIQMAQQPLANGNQELKIQILDGEDGVNIIKKKSAVQPVVEVTDRNDLPIAGVAVTIGLGAAGVFDSGAHVATVYTNQSGIATAPNFRPTGKGSFDIHVSANYQGRMATATIHQTNFSTVAAAQKAGRVPGSSSSSSASSGSSSSSVASNVATSAVSTGGAGGGVSGLAVAGIVVGGVAAAGVGAAYATGMLGSISSSQGPSCSSQLNNLQSVLTSIESCSLSNAQCLQTAAQNLLNAVGQACSCFGGGSAPSQYQSLFQEVISELQQEGYNTSQYQACFQ